MVSPSAKGASSPRKGQCPPLHNTEVYEASFGLFGRTPGITVKGDSYVSQSAGRPSITVPSQSLTIQSLLIAAFCLLLLPPTICLFHSPSSIGFRCLYTVSATSFVPDTLGCMPSGWFSPSRPATFSRKNGISVTFFSRARSTNMFRICS